MMISTRGRYALRLMIDIARQGEAGALVTMRQAAEREDLSVKYLEQLGGALVKAGVLKSVRGVSGGSRVRDARPLAHLNQIGQRHVVHVILDGLVEPTPEIDGHALIAARTRLRAIFEA